MDQLLLNKRLNISHTAHSNGTIVKYQNGMEKPRIRCLSSFLNETIKNVTQDNYLKLLKNI